MFDLERRLGRCVDKGDEEKQFEEYVEVDVRANLEQKVTLVRITVDLTAVVNESEHKYVVSYSLWDVSSVFLGDHKSVIKLCFKYCFALLDGQCSF